MKIFISWSGDLSNKVAIHLRDFLKHVIQATHPYMTAMDAPKGAIWLNEIIDNLNESKFGIVCLTKESLNSPWLLFETGALSKQFSKNKARVWTILIDGLSDEEIPEPLSIFQHTRVNEDDMLQLFTNVNNELAEHKLDKAFLAETFKTWWPKFLNEYETALALFPKVKKGKERLSRQEDALYRLIKLNTYLSEEIVDIRSDVAQIKSKLVLKHDPSKEFEDAIFKAALKNLMIKDPDMSANDMLSDILSYESSIEHTDDDTVESFEHGEDKKK